MDGLPATCTGPSMQTWTAALDNQPQHRGLWVEGRRTPEGYQASFSKGVEVLSATRTDTGDPVSVAGLAGGDWLFAGVGLSLHEDPFGAAVDGLQLFSTLNGGSDGVPDADTRRRWKALPSDDKMRYGGLPEAPNVVLAVTLSLPVASAAAAAANDDDDGDGRGGDVSSPLQVTLALPHHCVPHARPRLRALNAAAVVGLGGSGSGGGDGVGACREASLAPLRKQARRAMVQAAAAAHACSPGERDRVPRWLQQLEDYLGLRHVVSSGAQAEWVQACAEEEEEEEESASEDSACPPSSHTSEEAPVLKEGAGTRRARAAAVPSGRTEGGDRVCDGKLLCPYGEPGELCSKDVSPTVAALAFHRLKVCQATQTLCPERKALWNNQGIHFCTTCSLLLQGSSVGLCRNCKQAPGVRCPYGEPGELCSKDVSPTVAALTFHRLKVCQATQTLCPERKALWNGQGIHFCTTCSLLLQGSSVGLCRNCKQAAGVRCPYGEPGELCSKDVSPTVAALKFHRLKVCQATQTLCPERKALWNNQGIHFCTTCSLLLRGSSVGLCRNCKRVS